jgi:glycosyltransferase involved in cell wall biosynthesis
MPTVSIIIPTKDRCALLAETLASVQQQSYQDWECLVIDDGSSDGTIAMVSGLTDKDPRIRFIVREGEKLGANVCRNQGLHRSRGELIVFLDSDDLLAPHCLDRRVALLLRNPDLDFVVFGAEVFTTKHDDKNKHFHSQVLGDDLLRFLTNEFPWQTTGPAWRRKTLLDLGGFDETLPSWQDVDLHIRALCTGKKYLRFVETDHYIRWQFDENKISVQQRRLPNHLHSAQQTLLKFETIVETGPGFDSTRRQALSGLYFYLAECWIHCKMYQQALYCWDIAASRKLCNVYTHRTGQLLLMGLSNEFSRTITERIVLKWKGWVRFRINQ